MNEHERALLQSRLDAVLDILTRIASDHVATPGHNPVIDTYLSMAVYTLSNAANGL